LQVKKVPTAIRASNFPQAKREVLIYVDKQKESKITA